MYSLSQSDFIALPDVTQHAFMEMAEPFFDRCSGEFDLDGLKGAFDETMGTAAFTIQQIVWAAGGSDADVEEAVWAFIRSVQAAFRRIQ